MPEENTVGAVYQDRRGLQQWQVVVQNLLGCAERRELLEKLILPGHVHPSLHLTKLGSHLFRVPTH